MRILILGGTIFLGRALVEAALANGHQVSLFNRGQTNPDLFPQVEKLRGDRQGDLEALEGRRWEAAIDTSGYVPRLVRNTAESLAGSVRHYTFVSSISVYADYSQRGMDETAPLATIEDETIEQVTGETYGPLKALCEQAVEEVFAGRSLVVRPGLIVGPNDPTDRFTYWPYRVAQGGEVLAPGRPERHVQFIDVRDLAEWMLAAVELGLNGSYNATGPVPPVSMGELLDTCRTVSGSQAGFTWVSEEFLIEKGVGSWIEMPLWIPESDPELAGFLAVDVTKAIADGLTFRPAAETVRATLEWAATRPPGYEWRAGLSWERERALLDTWKSS